MHLKFWNRDWQTAGCNSGFSHGPHAISWCVAGMWMTTALPAAKHWKRSCSWAGSEMNLGTLAFLDSVFSYFLILSVSLWSSHLYNMLTCLNATLQAARRIAVFDEDTSNCSTLLQIAPLYVIYILYLCCLLLTVCLCCRVAHRFCQELSKQRAVRFQDVDCQVEGSQAVFRRRQAFELPLNCLWGV